MNDAERNEWVNGDKTLHRAWLTSQQSKRNFIRENRRWLTEFINAAHSGVRACQDDLIRAEYARLTWKAE